MGEMIVDWHAHENEDGLFLVVHGEFTMDFVTDPLHCVKAR